MFKVVKKRIDKLLKEKELERSDKLTNESDEISKEIIDIWKKTSKIDIMNNNTNPINSN